MRSITALFLFCGLLTHPLAAQVPSYVPTNGLVGWWPFNGNAQDASGNANHGVVTGALPAANRFGQTNSAYSFNGAEYITISNSLLPSTPTSFTISVWFSSSTLDGVLISDRGTGLNFFKYMVGLNGNTVKSGNYSSGCNNPQSLISPYSTQQWNHVVAVKNYQSGIHTMYLNGVVVAQENLLCYNSTTNGTSIGRWVGSVTDGYYEGLIDDIGVWSRPLTPTEITTLYTVQGPQVPSNVPTNGLMGWWPFNGNANDESGNGGHGTPQGAVLITDRSGVSNSAYAFDGINDFIQTTANGPTGAAPRTITFWEKTQSSSIITPLDYGGNGGGFQPILNSPCPGLGIDASIGVVTRGNSTVINNAWHHCAFVYDPSFGTTISNVVMYIDGVVQPTITCSAVNPNTIINTVAGVPIVFGKASSNVRYFSGAIDDIGLWNRALTASEIAALVTSQAPQVPSYVPTNGLEGWWPFNGNANDVSGNGHHGTNNGAVLTADRSAIPNTAYSFDGSSSFINISDAILDNAISSYSISLWMRTAMNTTGVLFSDRSGAWPYKYTVSFNNNAWPGQVGGAMHDGASLTNLVTTSSGDLGNGSWRHVVLVHDNPSLTLSVYVDGQLEGQLQGIEPGAWNSAPTSTSIGVWRGPAGFDLSHFFAGEIDDIGMWSRALTPGEVQDLYTTPAPGIRIAARIMLDGPYQTSTSLMNDALRNSGLVPAVEPYTDLGYFHIGSGGNEMALPGVLATVGVNAIVDWVVVELRDPDFNGFRMDTRSALLQRDGDVVDMDGVSPVTFITGPGTYFLSIKHRNHLGVMSAAPLVFGAGITPLDFTSVSTPAFGTAARKTIGSKQVLWAGDATGNGQLKYTGGANDRDPVLVRIGSTTPNNSAAGYYREDVNMDGVVKYTGSANDRDPILLNVGSTTPNAVRNGQVP